MPSIEREPLYDRVQLLASGRKYYHVDRAGLKAFQKVHRRIRNRPIFLTHSKRDALRVMMHVSVYRGKYERGEPVLLQVSVKGPIAHQHDPKVRKVIESYKPRGFAGFKGIPLGKDGIEDFVYRLHIGEMSHPDDVPAEEYIHAQRALEKKGYVGFMHNSGAYHTTPDNLISRKSVRNLPYPPGMDTVVFRRKNVRLLRVLHEGFILPDNIGDAISQRHVYY